MSAARRRGSNRSRPLQANQSGASQEAVVTVGSWGASVFANDMASEVRDLWRSAIARGGEPGAVTEDLVERYAPADGDADEVEFWTGLAAAQMETGRLQAA